MKRRVLRPSIEKLLIGLMVGSVFIIASLSSIENIEGLITILCITGVMVISAILLARYGSHEQ